MTTVAEYQTDPTTRSGLRRDLAASAYWRELPKITERHKGLGGFLKDEWHASGYYKSPKKRELYSV